MTAPQFPPDIPMGPGPLDIEPPPLEPLDIAMPVEVPGDAIPDAPILPLTDERRGVFVNWLTNQISGLRSKHGEIERFYAKIEDAYRAKPATDTGFPFKGHATETIPVMAATIEPIHARIDLGVNKQDPVLRVRALREDTVKVAKALEPWVNFRRRHILKMPETSSPAFLECCKLGTTVAKTTYEVATHTKKKYKRQEDGRWKAVTEVTNVQKPRVQYPSAADVIWPAGSTDADTVPIIIERQPWTVDELLIASDGDTPKFDREAVRKIIPSAVVGRSIVETERDRVNKDMPVSEDERVELIEAWFWYDMEQDPLEPYATRKPPSHYVATIHEPTGEILQLRLNYYFHQQHPYTIIPYTDVNGSLRGLGVGEMTLPFQEATTKWYRMASDNAYLANIRMFATPKGAMKELRIEMFAGRNINNFTDPQKDIKEIKLSDTYPSTMAEREYLDQFRQTRTGSSDYLAGNESQAVGSRATATGTLAVIQEGTRRVEAVLENFRAGEADIAMKCLSFDIQFGPGPALDKALDEEDAKILKEFFRTTEVDELEGAIAIELTATDAGGSRSAQQQNLMAVQQMVQQYGQNILGLAAQSMQAPPNLQQLMIDIAEADRGVLVNLLSKQDVPDAATLLPSLSDYVAIAPPPPPALPGPDPTGGAAGAGPPGQPPGGGPAGPPDLPQGAGPVGPGSLPPTGVGGVDRTAQSVERAFAGV
jgi:hypothetical protein